MAEKRTYRFKIDAYSRDTMPMRRLAEYLIDIAALLGEEQNVHLIAVESSSTCPVFLVDKEAEPKVIDRIQRTRNREGPDEAQRAVRTINARLREDNGSARLVGPRQSDIIEFPGANEARPIEWPSINQVSTLYGVPVWVGGTSEPAHVDLLDGEREWKCLASRPKAIDVAKYLYTATLRVQGKGRWRKTEDGDWTLERFVIDEYEVVKGADFSDAIQNLRSVQAAWKSSDDPLAYLDALRRGEQ